MDPLSNLEEAALVEQCIIGTHFFELERAPRRR
jgi:hypothetical protein